MIAPAMLTVGGFSLCLVADGVPRSMASDLLGLLMLVVVNDKTRHFFRRSGINYSEVRVRTCRMIQKLSYWQLVITYRPSFYVDYWKSLVCVHWQALKITGV